MATPFTDRADAGERLAERLVATVRRPGRVLALPRGGVVVAAPIAEQYGVPLDVVLVRKIGTPGHPELAMGALAVWGEHTALVRNEHVVSAAAVTQSEFERTQQRELREARRRAAAWGDPQQPELSGVDVLLVDDGLATGATMHAAVKVVRQAGAARVIAAVPVGAPDELRALGEATDGVVYVSAPRPFRAVGAHYLDFGQVDDATVLRTLRARRSFTA